ncbi:MAG: aminotransferase class V-fold PLP-dependent enzyme [Crocinitomicaceae bacterium]|nr:aminotransferase class V-fold PLP-dependent enzyme [Crocinitomicaceae bacterium]
MSISKSDFLLSEEYTHLNHGSFGACPKEIFADYQHWQLQLERDPVEFFTKTGLDKLEDSKRALASYINCDTDDLVYTTNPTYAINIIAKSLSLSPDDEVLATNHEYGALDRTWNYYCDKVGAKYVQQEIPIPLTSKEEFIEYFWKGYTPNTKAIFISHITSITALIFPVKEICAKAKELGLITIVDGAHVPGHIPLDLSELKADIYTGACHKWMLTPKGCSFLYVNKEIQNNFDPVIISWGYNAESPGKSLFLDYHQQQGTRDYSAFLTVPKSIEFLTKHKWKDVSNEAKLMLRKNYVELCELAGSKPICPVTSEFLGQICSIPVSLKNNDASLLKSILFEKYKIEIPVFKLREHIFMRLSTQAYIHQEDIDYLKKAIKEIKEKTDIFV